VVSDREPVDVDRLLEALRHDDERTVIDTFRGRSEPERRAAAGIVFALTREHQAGLERDRALYGACFACGTLAEIKRMDIAHQWGGVCNDVTYEVLLDRRPKWVTAWATWALDRQARPSGRGEGMWTLVRKLIRAGVCEPLDTDAYIIGMLFGLGSYQFNMPWDDEACRRHMDAVRVQRTDHLLLADPGLLEHEVWQIFEVPGRPSRQLGHTKPTRDRWTVALVTLSREGHLDRDRLLTATLDALARDITAFQANWFIGLWWTLRPTLPERQQHQQAVLHLLGHHVSAIVNFALGELERTQDGGAPGAPTLLVKAIEPALLTMPVATVKQALKLLDRIAKEDVSGRRSAVAAAATGLLHTNAAVRAATVRFIVRHAHGLDAELASVVQASLDGLTPEEQEKLRVALLIDEINLPVTSEPG